MKVLKNIGVAVVVVLGVILAAYLLTFIAAMIGAPLLFWGWNASVALIFGLPKITMMQAFWMIIVAGLLLKPVQTNNVQKDK